ncbi:MAG: alpha/beta fold hydrolase [Gemmatimonas sp.]|uniref:alpha/beta fold hydrolase n=1 Tax=Gemmatimonas sp. TaxID=1962908 RepID=UPI00391CD2BA
MSPATPLVPAVVVVHGALGSARQMAPVVEALRALRQFAEVVPVELPGHGETMLATGQPFEMTALADALGEAMARAAITRPLVFGYSMGGYAALVRELRAPGTIGGVVTLGTVLHWTPAIAARAARRQPHSREGASLCRHPRRTTPGSRRLGNGARAHGTAAAPPGGCPAAHRRHARRDPLPRAPARR